MKQLKNIYFDKDDGTGQGGTSGDEKKESVFSGDIIEKKDPVSQQTIKIPKELEPYIGHVIASTRSQIENQYKPMLEKIENENTELKEVKIELEKIKEAELSAEERAQKNAERKIKEYEITMQKSKDAAEMWQGRFFDTMVNNDIMASFGDVKLHNPEQVAILFRNEGKATVEEIIDDVGKPTGNFQTKVKLKIENDKGDIEIVEGTPGELFKKWVNQERNLHHQLNNLNPGGGSNNQGSFKGNSKALANMPAEQRLNAYFSEKQ